MESGQERWILKRGGTFIFEPIKSTGGHQGPCVFVYTIEALATGFAEKAGGGAIAAHVPLGKLSESLKEARRQIQAGIADGTYFILDGDPTDRSPGPALVKSVNKYLALCGGPHNAEDGCGAE